MHVVSHKECALKKFLPDVALNNVALVSGCDVVSVLKTMLWIM